MELRISPYRISFRTPFRTATHEFRHREGHFLKLSGSGISVWSEAAPLPGFSHETHDKVGHLLDYYYNDIENCLKQNRNPAILEFYNTLPASIRFGISMLWHQAKALEMNKSLCEYLKGQHTAKLPLNATLGRASVDEALKKVSNFVGNGYGTIKVKAGSDFEQELELLRKIRAKYPELTLRVDANRSWSYEEALTYLSELKKIKPEYCEEPLRSPTPEMLSRLRNETSIPIAADESVRSADDASQLLKSDAADVLILKPMLIGGIEEILNINSQAEDAGVSVVYTTSLEAGVGRLITAHIAAGLLQYPVACGLATGSMLTKDVFYDENFIEQGNFIIPEDAGLGATPDFSNVDLDL